MRSRSNSQRGSLLFLGGLCLAAGFAVAQDAVGRLAIRGGGADLSAMAERTVLPPRALDETDLAAARTAWVYFAQNTQAETGLANSVAGFPSATLWDQGSYILALIAARRLEVISADEFRGRATAFVETLAKMPLIDGRLPNKAYDTRTLAMVDYTNQPVPEGIGWSALDIARLLLSLRVLEEEIPELRDPLRATLKTWDIAALTVNGEIVGTTRFDSELTETQEGRIGYEQYAARALLLWGLDATMAASAGRVLAWEEVEGVGVGTDLRTAAAFGAIDAVLSEPYILMGLEIGLNAEASLLASRIYSAQEARFDTTGVPTMVTEDHLDVEPKFVYSAVYSNDTPWGVVADDGTPHPELRTVSTKAVFGWNALYGTDYTTKLRQELAPQLADANKGWAAGRYETDGRPNTALSLNTNAVILEAIHFKAKGPLLLR